MWWLGAVASLTVGLALPSIALVFGSVTGTFDSRKKGQVDDLMAALVTRIMILAVVVWALGYIQYAFMQQTSEQLTIHMRGYYLRSLLRQEVAFFEQNNVESMPSDVGQYFTQINKGIGDSIGQLLQGCGSFVGGIAIALYSGPVIAAVCFAYLPFVAIAIVFFGKYT